MRCAQLGTAAFEWKLDGARVQVHKAGDEVRVYTRNLNDVTARVPEIVEVVRASPRATLILDGEAIALRARRLAALRFSSRCAASAASSKSKRCGASCRCRCSFSIACCATTSR